MTVWLILIVFTITAPSTPVHVGNFENIQDCANAAKQTTIPVTHPSSAEATYVLLCTPANEEGTTPPS
jgi:hypothetical protein